MSSNREEIRWKLQQLLEIVSSTQKIHENEFDVLNNKHEKFISELFTVRNTLVGSIGSGLGLWVGLISIGVIAKESAIFITIPISIALCIFIGINSYAVKISKKSSIIEMEYRKHFIELMKIRSWILGRSMREDVTTEQIMTIIQFNSLITQAIAYEAKVCIYNQYKTEKPNQEESREYYNMAKNLPNDFQELHFGDFPIITSFIKTFETNELKKSK